MEYKKLGDICSIINGFAFKSNEYVNEGIRVIRITNVQKGKIVDEDPKFYSELNMQGLSKFLLSEDDILVSLTGNVGRVGLITKNLLPAALNQRVACLRPHNNLINTKYLYYFLNSNNFENICTNAAKGVAQLNLSTEIIREVEIPIPPLEVQKRIVEVLDKAQFLINIRIEQIKHLDDLIQSVFYDMFGDPVTNPKGWISGNLNNYIDFITSGSRGWAKYYSNSGKVFIRIQNVKNRKLSFSTLQFVQPPETKETERTKVKEKDLIISITADLGRTAVVDKSTAESGAHINQHLCLLRLNNKVNPQYVSYYIESPGGIAQIQRLDQIGVKSGLNFDAIKSLNILVPPINLQNHFADTVQKIEHQKQLMEKSLEEMQNNFNSLMQRAFMGHLFI